MYTLALDEYGEFEKAELTPTDLMFIGGVIFDDCDLPNEETLERRRIAAYYRAVFQAVQDKKHISLTFPKDLHVSATNNKASVRLVKNMVAATLPEFLEHGTFNGKELSDESENVLPPRSGRYYVFSVIKGEQGKNDNENFNEYLKDNFAANRYFHMADELIERFIFNTSYAEKKALFNIMFATRTTAPLPTSSEKFKEYLAFGYKANYHGFNGKLLELENGEKGAIVSLTNANIYRTIISHKLTDENPNEISIDNLKIDSISYTSQQVHNQAFLYLADSICSYLSFYTLNNKPKSSEEMFTSFRKTAEKLTSSFLLHVYDPIDTFYGKALAFYHTGDYFNALSVLYDMKSKDTPAASFYKEVWIIDLENRIVNTETKGYNYFSKAVRDLYYSQFSNQVNQGLGNYILEKLNLLADNLRIKGVRQDTLQKDLYLLYSAGVVAKCHLGDSSAAKKYFDKALLYETSASPDEKVRLDNMIATCYSDYLMFDKALAIAERNAKQAEEIIKFNKQMAPRHSRVNNMILAKSLSLLGQMNAYNRNAKAKKCFEKALFQFESKTPDYYITQSYLLHFYLDQNLVTDYIEESYFYFGEHYADEDKFMYILEEGKKDDPIINFKFALYLLVKGIYLMSHGHVTDSLWEKLRNLPEYLIKVFNSDRYFKGHPTVLTSKYLALIALGRNDLESFDTYKKIIEEAIADRNGYNGAAIIGIAKMSMINIHEKLGHTDEVNTRTEDLYEFLKRKMPSYKNADSSLNTEKKLEILKNSYVYMYN